MLSIGSPSPASAAQGISSASSSAQRIRFNVFSPFGDVCTVYLVK